MNKQKEALIAEGMMLLINYSPAIPEVVKITWLKSYDKLFGEANDKTKK